MAAIVGAAIMTVSAVVYAVRTHLQARDMVFPVLRAKVCVACGLRRDMLAFASTQAKRCVACTPLIKAAERPSGRTRIWRAQCARVRNEMGNALPRRGAAALLGVPDANQLWDILATRLKPGMTEDNYGEWHVDHACPVAAFDLSKRDHAERCFNVANLVPMWAPDNLGKSCALPNPGAAMLEKQQHLL